MTYQSQYAEAALALMEMPQDETSVEDIWKPQEGPQRRAIYEFENVREIFYGGARGGGKSDWLLGDFWINHASKHAARGVVFRRKGVRLEDMIRRSWDIYPATGAVWTGGAASRWKFPSGATLSFRHLWDLKESEDYKTYSYTWMAFEQAEEWPDPQPIDRLRGALRSAEGFPCRMRLTGNPGGVGHQWVKARYVDPAPEGFVIRKNEHGMEWLYLPALLDDNKILMENDPDYEKGLFAVGNEELIKGWRYGIWTISAGTFFAHVWKPDINKGIQLLHPFEIPIQWRFMRSFDWGFSAPASLGLWAISDGTPVPMTCKRYPGRVFPPGSFIRIGEWYTSARDASGSTAQPVKGQRLSNSALGAGIAQRSLGRKWSYSVADPSIFTEAGDDSIYESMRKGSTEFYAKHPRERSERAINFEKANHDRAAGWQKMVEMLEASMEPLPEKPGLWVVAAACPEWIRTVPSVPTDDRNLDDVNTDSEDHIADESRYAIMSRSTSGGGSIALR